VGKLDLRRILEEMRFKTEKLESAPIKSTLPTLPAPKRRAAKKVRTVELVPYAVPEARGQDLPELLCEVQRDAAYRLTRVMNWDNAKRQPWLLGLYIGWLDGVPYVGTGRVFIAGLMMPVVLSLLRQRVSWPLVASMVDQRGIRILSDSDLAALFPPRSAIMMDADVASFDDATSRVRIRGRGVRYESRVDATDLAMAWRGSPPPHRLMVGNDPASPVLLYDGQGRRSLIATIAS